MDCCDVTGDGFLVRAQHGGTGMLPVTFAFERWTDAYARAPRLVDGSGGVRRVSLWARPGEVAAGRRVASPGRGGRTGNGGRLARRRVQVRAGPVALAGG